MCARISVLREYKKKLFVFKRARISVLTEHKNVSRFHYSVC